MRRFLIVFAALVALASPALAEPLDDCKAQLPFGPPALTGEAPAVTYLCRAAYVTAHADALRVPLWVAWVLTGDHSLGCLPRPTTFTADPDLPKGQRAEPSDYIAAHYDRGHVDSFDDNAWGHPADVQSFLMSNMTPQIHLFNAGIWEALEKAERVWSVDRGELAIIAGPIFDPGKAPATIGANKVAVPTAFYKVLADPKTGEVRAFLFPHQAVTGTDLHPFLTSVEAVERATGITLPLPPGVDRKAVGTLWPADDAAWAAKKKTTCRSG